MTRTSTDDRPDTHDMVIIHRIFRRGFPQSADLARRMPPGDVARAAAVAGHIDFLLNGLHHHHTSEDEHLWPRLLERAEPDRLLVDRMQEQHEVVGRHIDHLRRILPTWSASPAGAEVADTLDELSGALVTHLDEEEREVLPLISAHLTVAEWEAMGKSSFAKFTNGEKFVALGQLVDTATPAETATMMATLPPPIRLIWRIAGRRRYVRYMAAVTGGASPSRSSEAGDRRSDAVPITKLPGGTRGVRMPPRLLFKVVNPVMEKLHRRAGDRFRGVDLMYLTTVGARSGERRTHPVGRFDDGRGGWFVVVSAGGMAHQPAWYHNIVAHPDQVEAEVTATRYPVTVEQLEGAERNAAWSEITRRAPLYEGYLAKTDRVIPVLRLTPVTP